VALVKIVESEEDALPVRKIGSAASGVTCGNAGPGHELASSRELPRLTVNRRGVWHVCGTNPAEGSSRDSGRARERCPDLASRGSAGGPAEVAAGECEDAVEQRRVAGHLLRRAERHVRPGRSRTRLDGGMTGRCAAVMLVSCGRPACRRRSKLRRTLEWQKTR